MSFVVRGTTASRRTDATYGKPLLSTWVTCELVLSLVREATENHACGKMEVSGKTTHLVIHLEKDENGLILILIQTHMALLYTTQQCTDGNRVIQGYHTRANQPSKCCLPVILMDCSVVHLGRSYRTRLLYNSKTDID